MLKKYNIFFIIGLLIMPLIASAQHEAKEVKVKINLLNLEGIVSVEGTLENLTSEYKSIYFKFSVFKNNNENNNKSKSVQDGRIILAPLQKVVITKSQFNGEIKDQMVLLLVIYDENNNIIGKDRIELGIPQLDKNSGKANDGIELKGILSNDTKTKLGNDFFEMFYTQYDKLNIKANKVVIVQEELTFGRTTKIMIVVDGEVINEFIARPDEEYLKFMSEYLVNEVNKFFKNIEKNNSTFVKY